MYIPVEEAITLIKKSSKYEHSLLVSRIMKALAKSFDIPEQVWILVGLLHDLDYEAIDDFTQHGEKASEQIGNRLPQEALHAIQAHDYRTGIKPESLLDEALIFADSLTGFLELNVDHVDGRYVLKDKPWLWNNLTSFPDKHNLDVLELIEQLVT
ncbi:HD domain-containing protein [Thermoproteota archaeon]